MLSTVMEILPEILQVLFFSSVSVGLSVGGVYIERFAMTTFQAGDTALAAWAAVLGAVVLAFAYHLLQANLAPTVRGIKNRLAR
ncbi:hypothetical protein [Halorubellus sp. PRR65]|uniref:hypothetical protein n=1 Tax=Halorubellus sp. PRR65 TaxID=3098148 RepID=UPI002B25FE78|nr:hypothetical protein [Halorubellus sp. PRR65]